MSVFRRQTVTCPSCNERVEFNVVHSVNADRRPDLRAAIIDGSFQRFACPKCATAIRLDPEMNYVELGRNQWIAAWPISRFAEWQALDERARSAFARAYGNQAPAAARELGVNLRPRATFGWAALREKLIAPDYQLDDVNLELLKTVLIAGVGSQPVIANNTELRLIAVEGDELQMAWIHSASETLVERMGVPRSLYDEVVADEEGFAAMRAELAAGLFVDMNRLLLATP